MRRKNHRVMAEEKMDKMMTCRGVMVTRCALEV